MRRLATCSGYAFAFRWWFSAKTWTSLDEAVRHAARVRQLHLMHDYDLAPLGPQFARLRHLRSLHLQGPVDESQPFALPAEIGELPELRELLLLNHPLREVPAWLTNLPRLRCLMISGSDITALPADIGRLRQLALLRVENGLFPLATLPESFRELTQLRRLSFRAGRVEHLPVELLPPHLTHLELSWSAQFSGVDFDALYRRFPRLHVRISGGR